MSASVLELQRTLSKMATMNSLDFDVLNRIIDFLPCYGYVAFIGTCKGFYGLKDIRRKVEYLKKSNDGIWFSKNKHTFPTFMAFKGQLDVLEYLHTNNEHIPVDAMLFASRKGHLDVFIWIRKNVYGECMLGIKDHEALNNAAFYGHLDIIKWFHENTDCTTENAMAMAAKNGHLNVVKWLQENRPEESTSKAVDMAASSGHLDIVKLLCKDGTKKHRTAADRAIWRGQLDIVKFLCESGEIRYTKYAIIKAHRCAKNSIIGTHKQNCLEIVQYLHEKYGYEIPQ